MKKIAKISLVAAVAVAGFTTANAQPLEEAIKGVEVSGSVVYRYNENNRDVSRNSTAVDDYVGVTGRDSNGNNLDPQTASDTSNNYKAALGLAAKVNDDVKLNTRFLVANDSGSFAGGYDEKGLNTQTGGDTNVDVELSNVYFGYTGVKNMTINAGKQGLTTPWTVAVDSDGNEQTGTGILALSTLGNVTLACAYFNQTNLGTSGNLRGSTQTNSIVSSRDLATVGTIVALGPVTVDAWVADMQTIFQTYTLGAKTSTSLGDLKLGFDARYTELELDRDYAEDAFISAYNTALNNSDLSSMNLTNNVNDDHSLAKLTVTADYGIFDAKVAYGKTGKEGGLTALDNDASTTLLAWNVNSNGKADADYWQLVLGVDLLDNLNLSANYVNVDYTSATRAILNGSNSVSNAYKTSVEEEEIYAQLTYKMSKNLTAYTRYGVYTKDTSEHTDGSSNVRHGDSRSDVIDDTVGRVQVEYTF